METNNNHSDTMEDMYADLEEYLLTQTHNNQSEGESIPYTSVFEEYLSSLEDNKSQFTLRNPIIEESDDVNEYTKYINEQYDIINNKNNSLKHLTARNPLNRAIQHMGFDKTFCEYMEKICELNDPPPNILFRNFNGRTSQGLIKYTHKQVKDFFKPYFEYNLVVHQLDDPLNGTFGLKQMEDLKKKIPNLIELRNSFIKMSENCREDLDDIKNDDTTNDVIRYLKSEDWIKIFQHKGLCPQFFIPDHLAIFNLSWDIAEKIQIWYTVFPNDLRTMLLKDKNNMIDGNFLQDYKDYGHNFSAEDLTFEEIKDNLLRLKNDPKGCNKQLPSYVTKVTGEIVPQLCSDGSKTLVIASQTKLVNLQKYIFENVKQTHLQISDRGKNEKGSIDRIYNLGNEVQTKFVECPDETTIVKDKSMIEKEIDKMVKRSVPNILVLVNAYEENKSKDDSEVTKIENNLGFLQFLPIYPIFFFPLCSKVPKYIFDNINWLVFGSLPLEFGVQTKKDEIFKSILNLTDNFNQIVFWKLIEEFTRGENDFIVIKKGDNGGSTVEFFHLRIELTGTITFNTKARPIRFLGTEVEDHFIIDMCPICMDHEETMVTKRNRDEFYITGCKHIFCRTCLDKHKETDSKCPICRQEKLYVDDQQEQLFEELVKVNSTLRKRKDRNTTPFSVKRQKPSEDHEEYTSDKEDSEFKNDNE